MFPAHKYQSVSEFIPYELLNHLECVRSFETHTHLFMFLLFIYFILSAFDQSRKWESLFTWHFERTKDEIMQ